MAQISKPLGGHSGRREFGSALRVNPRNKERKTELYGHERRRRRGRGNPKGRSVEERKRKEWERFGKKRGRDLGGFRDIYIEREGKKDSLNLKQSWRGGERV